MQRFPWAQSLIPRDSKLLPQIGKGISQMNKEQALTMYQMVNKNITAFELF
jgi:hypothetical protein